MHCWVPLIQSIAFHFFSKKSAIFPRGKYQAAHLLDPKTRVIEKGDLKEKLY